jgi:hypothetical protein
MRASLERHCEHRGTIRVHESDEGGDDPYWPYFWVSGCGFTYEGDPATIYLGGNDTKMTPSAWLAILDLLRREGFAYAVWEKLRARTASGPLFHKIKWDLATNSRVFG